MCGLFGYVSRDGASAKGEAALRLLAHRGPDRQGAWSDDRVYLGHRRLSIIDLSERASQPLRSEDAAVLITVNGEIYNFQALRRELAARYQFQTSSDSEVVLHGYRAWGMQGLLQRLEGMYALCIYDTHAQRVFLARDRVGIKPLYWGRRGGAVAWASELKALAAFFEPAHLQLDTTAMYDFLTYMYVPAPKTMYRDVFKLEPAHYLEIDVQSAAVQVHRYWQLEVRECEDTVDTAAERVRSLIGTAVEMQLCSDVPVGFFLSGGMDSSVVVREAAARSTAPLNTYCIGFDDPANDETAFAQLMADSVGAHHRVRHLQRAQIEPMFARLRGWFDEPFADASAFPTYLVSKFARETCTVALSGDGGDELFGGYRRYEQFRRHVDDRALAPRAWLPVVSSVRRRFRDSLAGKLANRLELGMLDDLELYTRLLGGLLKEQKRRYAVELGIAPDYDDYWRLRQFYRPELPSVTRLQYLDFHTYLPDDILTKVDRVSMDVSLEARVPLLATDVVEYAFALPEAIRLHGERGKGLLRYAYRDLLPAAILERSKQGFGLPSRSYARIVVPPGGSMQESVLNELFATALNAA